MWCVVCVVAYVRVLCVGGRLRNTTVCTNMPSRPPVFPSSRPSLLSSSSSLLRCGGATHAMLDPSLSIVAVVVCPIPPNWHTSDESIGTANSLNLDNDSTTLVPPAEEPVVGAIATIFGRCTIRNIVVARERSAPLLDTDTSTSPYMLPHVDGTVHHTSDSEIHRPVPTISDRITDRAPVLFLHLSVYTQDRVSASRKCIPRREITVPMWPVVGDIPKTSIARVKVNMTSLLVASEVFSSSPLPSDSWTVTGVVRCISSSESMGSGHSMAVLFKRTPIVL